MEQLRRPHREIGDGQAHFQLLVTDARRSCDDLVGCGLLGSGRDGWLPVGIDPDRAHDTTATIAEASCLHEAVERLSHVWVD